MIHKKSKSKFDRGKVKKLVFIEMTTKVRVHLSIKITFRKKLKKSSNFQKLVTTKK